MSEVHISIKAGKAEGFKIVLIGKNDFGQDQDMKVQSLIEFVDTLFV